MIQVKDGKVVKEELPKNGFLADGRAVSNYRYLPKKELEKEGWVEPLKVIPTITEDQELGNRKYELKNNKWIETYEVREKPKVVEPAPDPIKELEKRIEVLEARG